MQNPLPFYSDYNTYGLPDDFLSNGPDLSVESDVFAPTTMSNNPIPVLPAATTTTTSNMPTSKKRKATIDTEASYSPASIYSESSNYSDGSYPTFNNRSIDPGQSSAGSYQSNAATRATTINSNLFAIPSNLTTSAEEGSSDENDEDGEEETSAARKREKHTKVEAQRRALEKAHFRELASLITNRGDTKATKLHHLDLLKIAADQITEINLRHQHDPLRPSNLTDSELNFLTIEASNSFIFVTTMEPALFRILYVTESINRILQFTPNQWCGQSFFSFIHPEDTAQVQRHLLTLNSAIGMKVHFDCRMKQSLSNDRYSSVVIDGTTKKIDQSYRPVQNNAPGYLAFIGICHIPLKTKYSETNMSLHKDPHVSTFRCRCSPHDWKIFLVDRSVSTLPSVPYETFRDKSILDYIHPNDQGRIHQILLRSTTSNASETVLCHFVHPILHSIINMNLEVKSLFNPVLHRADFIELTFKSCAPAAEQNFESLLYDDWNSSKEIDKLFENELSSTLQQSRSDPTTQNAPFQYSTNWPTKSEHF